MPMQSRVTTIYFNTETVGLPRGNEYTKYVQPIATLDPLFVHFQARLCFLETQFKHHMTFLKAFTYGITLKCQEQQLGANDG
jgi:hypothetical protein